MNNPTPGVEQLSNDLLALFGELNKRKVSYLLVGGVALLRYIEGRNTEDVDLIVALDAPQQIPQLSIRDRTDDTARGRFLSLQVDLLFTNNPVFALVERKHATVHKFAEISVPCATVAGLVLLKLYALPSLYRQGQLQRAALYETDITMLCERHKPDLPQLLATLRSHVTAGELAELQQIAQEIQQRVQRMQASRENH